MNKGSLIVGLPLFMFAPTLLDAARASIKKSTTVS